MASEAGELGARANRAQEWLLFAVVGAVTVLVLGAGAHPFTRCWLGDGRSCGEVGDERRVWAEQRACDLGELFHCTSVARRLIRGDELPKNVAQGLKLLVETCERSRKAPSFGAALACEDAAKHLYQRLDLAGQSRVASTCCEVARRGGDTWFGRCCLSGEELRRRHELALAKAVQSRTETPGLESACAHNDSLACVQLAERLTQDGDDFPIRRPAERARSRAILRDLCQRGTEWSYAAARACEALLRIADDPAERREVRQMACARVHASGTLESDVYARVCESDTRRPQ